MAAERRPKVNLAPPCFRHAPSLWRATSDPAGSPKNRMMSRRRFAQASVFAMTGVSALVRRTLANAAENPLADLGGAFKAIEAEASGRLGVAILDTKSGASAGHRANERFPMCSTFKAVAAAAILAKVDAGKEQLTRRIAIKQSDILSYAPIAKQHVDGEMSVAELCEAAITLSDNSAANILLRSLGGPAALTEYVRSLGDPLTRFDRFEPDLNEATPGDPRDTSTPAAMAATLNRLATGAALSPGSRDQWIAWLVACKTSGARLRAGLPKTWRIGDKTGSGERGSTNDVAIIWPEGRAPVIVAAFLTETAAPEEKRNAAHAAIGRAIAGAFGG
jgi:beta-lactamase class A